jgi:hypothetical protein
MRECKNLKIRINKPTNTKSFLEAFQVVRTAKRKATNLLFEEIE